MSTRGRKAELQVIEGGLKVEPEIPAHIPDAMRSEWLSVVADLKERRVLNEAMFGSIDSYVLAMWNMRQAQEALDKYGPLIDAGKGILKVNPASSMLGKAQSTMLRLAAELGLTPASRSRSKMKGGDGRRDPDEGDLFGDLVDI